MAILVSIGIYCLCKQKSNSDEHAAVKKAAPRPRKYDLSQRLDTDARGNGSDIEMPPTAVHRKLKNKNKENENSFVVPSNKGN